MVMKAFDKQKFLEGNKKAKENKKEFPEIPPGIYNCELTNCCIKECKSEKNKGQPMVEFEWQISEDDEDYKNQRFWKYFVLVDEGYTKLNEELFRLGVDADPEVIADNFDDILEKLIGTQARIKRQKGKQPSADGHIPIWSNIQKVIQNAFENNGEETSYDEDPTAEYSEQETPFTPEEEEAGKNLVDVEIKPGDILNVELPDGTYKAEVVAYLEEQNKICVKWSDEHPTKKGQLEMVDANECSADIGATVSTATTTATTTATLDSLDDEEPDMEEPEAETQIEIGMNVAAKHKSYMEGKKELVGGVIGFGEFKGQKIIKVQCKDKIYPCLEKNVRSLS